MLSHWLLIRAYPWIKKRPPTFTSLLRSMLKDLTLISLPCFYVPVRWTHCSSISYGISPVPKTILLFWVMSHCTSYEDRYCPAQQFTKQEHYKNIYETQKVQKQSLHTKSKLTLTPGTCWVSEKPLTTLHLHYRKTFYFLGTAQMPTQSSSSLFLEGGCGCPCRFYEKSRIPLLCMCTYQYGQL